MGESFGRCYGINMPILIHRSKPNPQVDGIRTWGLWEVIRSRRRAHTSGISALAKGTPHLICK